MTVSLRDAAGVSIGLSQGSLLIGRAPSCHVVVSDPHASRRHVLVLEGEACALVVPLGRTQIELRGAPISEPTEARHGDVLVVGGARFTFEIPELSTSPAWSLEVGGRLYPVRRSGFRIGGSESADVRLPGWPPDGAKLFPVTGALLAEIEGPVTTTERVDESGLARLGDGSRLSCGGFSVVVRASIAALETADYNPAPSHAAIELMPNGALLRLTLDREHRVWLPQKRGDLVAALLSPLAGVRPGDWVSDDLLVQRVWGSESVTRTQLNTLIHRTRMSLSGAGLNGPSLLERAPGGGATRLRLAKDAEVSVA